MDVYQILLERSLKNIVKAKKLENHTFEITPFSTRGANYSSLLFIGKISASNREELKFFAKVATFSNTLRLQLPTRFYYTEQYTYSVLAKVFDKIENKRGIPIHNRLKIPELYGYIDTECEEVLVTSDLSALGFTTYNRFLSINWEYASKAIEELAKLHALGFAMQKDFPDDYKKTKESLQLRDIDGKTATNILEQMMRKAVSIIKEEYRDKLINFMAQLIPNAMQLFFGPSLRPTLVHGDFRMSNLMHKIHMNNQYEIVIIDYQTLHIGSVIKDLMYFIFTGSDSEFRVKYYQQLLAHYYEHLCLALSRLDLEAEQIFPRKDFDRELEQFVVLGLVFAVITLPVVTAEEENVPDLKDYNVESMIGIKTSHLCITRLNEVVEDFIKLNILK
ncbi:hypothetical protein ACJJTC_011842 [Scirpophaga incertulas]